ncbi:MAG: ATP synthase F1 subunit gamma [Acidobacteria bacterium RIFCSPLOWO2_12_FULL_67_14]|nr:MAG: ATP synthase F1 subunit gamma [Acidobacteria bacterium RIFCSPLOWO2_02_FULL_67_21]OFW38191.1 MAG: ATP synthase F1 subunit gamma [Acidobacteria bacterium RIFCSPLOWO2_12_FULL_67_14]
MPSLIDLRRRIRAVKSTQQITKAMKMIAASRLKRAQDRVIAARPYAQRMMQVLHGLAARVDPDAHPLLRPGAESGRPLAIVVTADRGLCGSFNSNVIKAAGQFIISEGRSGEVTLGLIGRKGRDFFRRRGFDVRVEQTGIFQRLSYVHALEIANAAIDEFVSGRASRVYLIYNEFKSVMTQRLATEQLLPIPRIPPNGAGAVGAPGIDGDATAGAEYLYEPNAEAIFSELLPRYVQAQVYRALLESNAAFFAAQMTAMDAATRNSSEMIDSLTLYMNKVRQAAITREIIEVVSGASAT